MAKGEFAPLLCACRRKLVVVPLPNCCDAWRGLRNSADWRENRHPDCMPVIFP